MDDKMRGDLHNQLVKCADILETCDVGDSDHTYYNKEYKKIAKLLYPDAYQSKKRKPTQSIIRTLKPCDCGEPGWKFMRFQNGVKIACKKCDRISELSQTNSQARDSWNNTFVSSL